MTCGTRTRCCASRTSSTAEATQARLDKAAATQMVFEDALMHVIDHFIRATGSDRLVLTGGIGLNALGNMRLLEHFDRAYYRRALSRDARLHLWVPPVPNDAGVTVGAAYMGAYLAGYGLGEPIEHAFYCGMPPARKRHPRGLAGEPRYRMDRACARRQRRKPARAMPISWPL